MTKRASGLATYRNTDFFGVVDGLDLTLQYQGKTKAVKPRNRTATASVQPATTRGSDFAVSGLHQLRSHERSEPAWPAARVKKRKPGRPA